MTPDLRPNRAALLTAPRTEFAVTALPPEVRVYLGQFPDALEVEARRLVVNGVPYFELLRVHAYEDADEDETFVTGTIVDSAAAEVVELDFVERTATFLPGAAEVERDQRLSRFADKHLTTLRLENGPFEPKLPAAIEKEPDAKGHRFEFDGRTYFAQSYREAGVWEALVYDEQGRGLGGNYDVGTAQFELAEVEPTLPLADVPAKAQGTTSGNDDFMQRPKPKVVF